jgi:hypothetical protein
MNKPASLRAALVAAIPALGAQPDKLVVFIDQGSVVATGTRSLSFEYRYVVNIILLDFAGEADAVMTALIEWARTHQPDLVADGDARDSGIQFEVDVLNNATCDLSVKLPLTENVVVATGPDGQRLIDHVNDAGAHWTADR